MGIRTLLTVSLVALTVSIPTAALSIPPAPPAPSPFDDPAVAIRFTTWRTANEQICMEAGNRLSDARIAIGAARPAGHGTTDDERRAAARFAAAERRCLDSVHDLMVLAKDVKDTGSRHDLQVLEEVLNSKLLWVYGTAPNTVEILESVSQ